MRALRRYLLIATLLLGGLLCGTLAGASLARDARHGSIGPLPPAHPARDCAGWGLAAIDACRAQEGVGPLLLPRNWSRLSIGEQLLVLVDLERVNRGLAPMAALIRPLNALARIGARRHEDPPFPDCRCFIRVGGIYAMSQPPSVFEADELWMYDDAGSAWGHRANILMSGSGLVAGAGATRNTWDMEMAAGLRYRASQVTFRWASELRFFARRPGREPLR